MSSFPLTVIFFKMGTLHHQPDILIISYLIISYNLLYGYCCSCCAISGIPRKHQFWSAKECQFSPRISDVGLKLQSDRSLRRPESPRATVATVSRANWRDDWEKLSHVEPVCRSKFSPMKWLEWPKWPACESWLPRTKRSESVARDMTFLISQGALRALRCAHLPKLSHVVTPNSLWIEMPQFLAGRRAHRPTDVLQFQRSSTSM